MEEVFTCMCGKQHLWTIYRDRIGCGFCGREYKRTDMDPCAFNQSRKQLLLKDAEVTEGETD